MLSTVFLPAVSIYIYIFLNSKFKLEMLVNPNFSLSAESNQETASLPIDRIADRCEVGRFVLTIKSENS